MLQSTLSGGALRIQQQHLGCFCSRNLRRLATRRIVVNSNIQDDLLDFVTAGPKMRKWYGQGERLPRDGVERNDEKEPDPEPVEEGDTIFVMEADTDMGELVVLQLILKRAKIKVAVRDVAAAKSGYGPYVTPVSVDLNNPTALAAALKGVRAVVCVNKLGALPQVVVKARSLQHVVLLSAAGHRPGALAAWLNPELSSLCDPSREAALARSGLPYTIVRVPAITDTPGGQSSLSCARMGAEVVGVAASAPLPPGQQGVSREDVALVLASALEQPPRQQEGVVVQVAVAGPGQPPQDWTAVFAS